MGILILLVSCPRSDYERTHEERKSRTIPLMPRSEAVGQDLNAMSRYASQKGSVLAHRAVEVLKKSACGKGTCDGAGDRATEESIEQIALRLLEDRSPDVRNSGLLLACSFCEIAGKDCSCNGGECRPEDIVPANTDAERWRLGCGYVERPGTVGRRYREPIESQLEKQLWHVGLPESTN